MDAISNYLDEHALLPLRWIKESPVVSAEKVISEDSFTKPIMALDFVENEKEYLVYSEIPGAIKDDIDIKIENGLCTINAIKKKRFGEEGDSVIWHRRECGFGSAERQIKIPWDCDPAISPVAHLSNGVLQLKFAKVKSNKPADMKIVIT